MSFFAAGSAAITPGSEHVVEYHVITSGSCWASVPDRDIAPVRLEADDVVTFPQGDAHVMSSAPGMRCKADLSNYASAALPNRIAAVGAFTAATGW